ncbi:MAG TPA: branched-chain amino acid ABC transporter permease [Anaerolineaceae bacterium]|nr:branched-chain amino acid ABC transporter permease [Chloroflexota bacterium]HNY83450.1 branched-chain amino acid ABC transporter permease [Anaerolineaceae bacterium]
MVLQLIINGISLGAVYTLIAVGFAIVFTILRFSNFAHGGMISACAFIGYFFQRYVKPTPPFALTVIFTAVCGIILALAIDFFAYQRIRINKSPSIYYFLVSLTVAILIEQILIVFFGTNMYGYPAVFETQTMQIGSFRIKTMNLVILAVSLSLLFALMILLNKTKIGLAIRAVAIDPNTSRLMGINSNVVITTVFAIAGLLAGVSGVFIGMQYSVYPSLGPTMMLKGFIASVVGGMGSLGGAIIAALFLGLIEIISTYFLGATTTTIIMFAIMLGFLFIRPQGISGKFAEDKV